MVQDWAGGNRSRLLGRDSLLLVRFYRLMHIFCIEKTGEGKSLNAPILARFSKSTVPIDVQRSGKNFSDWKKS